MEEDSKLNKKIRRMKILYYLVYILFLIGAILLTRFCISLKIKNIEKQFESAEHSSGIKFDDDVIHNEITLIETYDANQIDIESYCYQDGQLLSYYPGNGNFSTCIKIFGLKDEEVQKKVNDRLYNVLVEDPSSVEDVVGSFSNVLSIKYNHGSERKFYGINIDLNTGKDIKFEDLLLDSAPIYKMLLDAYCKAKAWNQIDGNIGTFDFNNVDSTDYEDYLFIVKKYYDANKEKLNFAVDTDTIYIYNFNDEVDIEIPMYYYKDHIAIFKKFVDPQKDIYNGAHPAPKSVVAYEKLVGSNITKVRNIYERTDDHIIDCAVGKIKTTDKISKYISNEKLQQFVNEKVHLYLDDIVTVRDQYKVLQAVANVSLFEETDNVYAWNKDKIPYYCISIHYGMAVLPHSEYWNLGYYFSKVVYEPTSGSNPLFIARLTDEVGSKYETYEYYYDLEGKFLGNHAYDVPNKNQ